MLYKVFVDDSGMKDYNAPYSRDFKDNPPAFEGNEQFWRENYFVLCGVRIKQSDIGIIDAAVRTLKIACFGTADVEIKSTWLRIPDKRKKHYLDPYGITVEQLNKFGDDLHDLIAQNADKMKVIGVVFDKRYYGDAKRATGDGNPFLKTTQIMLERINYAGNINVVTFDQFESSLSLEKGAHNKIRGIFTNNLGMETKFSESYENIVDVDFKKSCDENFLQIADICAYNIHRQFTVYGREWCGDRVSADGKKQMETYDYFEKIRCNFHANAQGNVRGCGLTCVPDVNKVNWNFHQNCPIQ